MAKYEIRELRFDSWADDEGVVESTPIVAVLKTHWGNEHCWYVTALVEVEDGDK